ncbi:MULTISPECIES: hypothetical protein [unclassified Duganella]|uniref:hypothetical protein n=1 Tax=unclassified Duganella TaxID=2636909 RepID=UPI0006FC130A|nr:MULTISPECIES: hypothetical protein [unclassified Duganella]KQV59303.1 hypothetical protein ASD07_24080 [Duganella sp. Root336D2]KRC01402.1 hypothetical protein ASE26_20450 [Duganella sp. Root198D2]
MNISLTIICTIAVALATAIAFLAQDDVKNGVIFPWQFIASCVIGFLITHGEYYVPTFAWMYGHLADDGIAGGFLSACVAALAEICVASLPMLAGIALHVFLSAWDERFPLTTYTRLSRRDWLVSFLRGFAIR